MENKNTIIAENSEEGKIVDLAAKLAKNIKLEFDSIGHLVLCSDNNGRVVKAFKFKRQAEKDKIYGVYLLEVDGSRSRSTYLHPAEIEEMSTKIDKIIANFTGFTQQQKAEAKNRLWLANFQNSMEERAVDSGLNIDEIREFFLEYISCNADTEVGRTKVYIENVNGRIDIGIWEEQIAEVFANVETSISLKQWKAEAKAHGWLEPDKGRGGGQHNPATARAKLYDKTGNARICRFKIEEKEKIEIYERRQKFLTTKPSDSVKTLEGGE